MGESLTLFDDKKVKKHVKLQFKKILDSSVDVEMLLDVISNRLDGKFVFTRNSDNEIAIKIDKRKKKEKVQDEVQEILNSIQVDFDLKYLIKILDCDNEIILRVRRKR